MVTVISTTKEELITPVKNGVTGGGSCDNERPFQFIKDYQEVDFYRSPSCKPLPEDLMDINTGELTKSSIQGTFFLQIDAIEPFIQISNNQNDYNRLLLTLTDGILTIKALTNDSIPNLTFHTKIGSKLLLTDSISIGNHLLQLTHDNTTFQYGSNTYPRPRSAYRGRTGGSYRSNNEGRRNGRYDNENGENNFFKRPPPKNTLMDFMTSLKLSNDTEIEKPKEYSKRQSNHSLTNDQNLLPQDDFDESLDPEDESTNGNNRERRNPLPPRLQRAQEERSRRNTVRYYDESGIDQGLYPSSHLPYFHANSGPLTFNPSFHNQQTLLASSYSHEHFNNFCCGIPYPTYLPTVIPSESKFDENSTTQNDENNDSGIKCENSTTEQKLSSATVQENQTEEKRREPRPRWKIGDTCFAKWNEDGEFYYATIMDIQPPYCTVLFVEYNTYDQVHFNNLKLIPRDQQFYPFIPPTSDLNVYAANGYFPPRGNYYPPTMDGCLIMPEAPPFPFNSAGTLYMYPTPLSHTNGYQTIENGELILNSSSSPPSKDSNDTSVIDSTTTSNDENHQQDNFDPQPASIADAPLTLVTSDDLRQDNTNDKQQQQEEEEEKRE